MGYSRGKSSRSLSPKKEISSSAAIAGLFYSSTSLSAVPSSSSASLRMGRKSVLAKQTLVAVMAIISLYAFFNTFFFSPSSTLSDASRPLTVSRLDTSGDAAARKAKIYMYDLPTKFTYGVIESYTMARGGLQSPVKGDFSKLKYPGNQHSAEWHLFSDLLSKEAKAVDYPIIRVSDPEEADLFYVPFFSSLSLVANPFRPNTGLLSPGPSTYSDEEMQESLMEWLEGQKYWKRNNGWDHVFICQDPNALYKEVDRIKNSVLLVSDFGRLRNDQGSLVKDVILPYDHRIRSFEGNVGVRNRNSLLFFMGNRYRKEGGKIRDLLFQVLENEVGVIMKHGSQSRESRREATQGMHTSKFCLHPAGDTPSAARLFDAIVSLCIPVIVSDQIELPFENVIDYQKIAIFVDSSSAIQPGYLLDLLRAISTRQILACQKELKKVKHLFEYDHPNGTVREIWHQVSQKIPLIKLMTNRDKRLIQSELSQQECSCLCSNRTAAVEL